MGEEKIRTDWIVTEVNIMEEGKLLEIHFKSAGGNVSQHKVILTADHWLKGSWAEFKLAEFMKSLSKTIDILDGRR